MGHSGQMALSTYLHVVSELGDERISARTPSYPREPQNDDKADAA